MSTNDARFEPDDGEELKRRLARAALDPNADPDDPLVKEVRELMRRGFMPIYSERGYEVSVMNPVVETYMARRRSEGDLGTEGMLVEDVRLMAEEARDADLRDFLTAVIDGVPEQDDPEPVVEFQIPERLYRLFYALMIEVFDNV